MNDDASNIDWLRNRIARAARHAEELSDDIYEQDGLRLTGTVMRLDRVRDALDDAWRTLQLVYDEALERDRAIDANRTVGEPSDGSGGVVADILRASATGFRQPGSDLHHRAGGATDVAV
jgi:hypothetical protein